MWYRNEVMAQPSSHTPHSTPAKKNHKLRQFCRSPHISAHLSKPFTKFVAWDRRRRLKGEIGSRLRSKIKSAHFWYKLQGDSSVSNLISQCLERRLGTLVALDAEVLVRKGERADRRLILAAASTHNDVSISAANVSVDDINTSARSISQHTYHSIWQRA